MLNVRSGRVADMGLIVDFQVRMAAETEGMDLNRETVTRGVQAVFDDSSKGAYWIAEEAGEVVGGSFTVSEWSDWRNGTVLWIHSVYVIPEARKQGVFRALYHTLKEQVKASENLCGLRLYVEKGNTRAQQVYGAMGMDGEHYQLYEWLK